MATKTLPNRKDQLIYFNIIITSISTIFAIWRLIVRWRITRSSLRQGLTDYLMVLAVMVNISSTTCIVVSAFSAHGRVDSDPYVTPERRMTTTHLIYASQVTNMYTMFLTKLSISAYLMTLYFSPSYKAIVWVAVGIICLCNFLLPSVNFHGQCKPVAMRWDPSIKGHCWDYKVRLVSTYTQVSTNVLTDLIFTASPILYLQKIKLPRRTQWGVRIVFLLCLIGTAISVARIWALHEAFQPKVKGNKLYIGVPASILSVSEVGVAIITACLPPLRKTFDSLLGRFIPNSFLPTEGSSKTGRTYTLSTYRTGSNYRSNATSSVGTGTGISTVDEWRILEEEDGDVNYSRPVGATTLITADELHGPAGGAKERMEHSHP
ncbi:hypothetical protein BJ875DRAFT_267525 [Amylocarpus encephaloides]|uniref:Rhodopsin domain-containing protein n=1 Tax=Amylocarpus encephaloides TaxID=45428 RepID=A0A9P7YL71_9HELO|nr:hypothetical protein BJ875DRAFT_267525 [Amylocarpus encephaloides]